MGLEQVCARRAGKLIAANTPAAPARLANNIRNRQSPDFVLNIMGSPESV
jgi:hypothetical protein